MGWEKGLLLGRGQFGMVYQGKLKDGTETAVCFTDTHTKKIAFGRH